MSSCRMASTKNAITTTMGGTVVEVKDMHMPRIFRRTCSLSFCPLHEDSTTTDVVTTTIQEDASSSKSHNLVEMEFVLSLEPSVRVLHSYYLADALGVDSSMVYKSSRRTNMAVVKDLGSYTSDTILNEIDTLNNLNNNMGLTLDQVQFVLQSHLLSNNNESGVVISWEHACLLHQYTLHKSTGRSIHGQTKVYHCPHVSNFYPTASASPSRKLLPALLSFTGYADQDRGRGCARRRRYQWFLLRRRQGSSTIRISSRQNLRR
jgi:hypothetical protein